MKLGDYITVCHEIGQLLPECSEWKRDMQVIHVRFMPWDAGDPLRVEGVCLPFVLVSTPQGKHETLDLRRQEIVRLDPSFGRSAFKKMKPPDKDSKKKRKRNKK